MAPLDLFRSRTVAIPVAVGFVVHRQLLPALPFVMSLYLQQLRRPVRARRRRGLLAGGAVPAPALTPSGARVAEKLGARVLITTGLVLMTTAW